MMQSVHSACSSHIEATNKRLPCLCRTQNKRQLHIILLQKNVWMYTNLLRKMWWCVWIFIWKNVNDVDFDANINRDMRMKIMILFIDIKLRVVYKYIYLHHAYCYLNHLCAWWCRCICIWICKCICRWIQYITSVIYYSINICMCKW